jgi:hypothetical protein
MCWNQTVSLNTFLFSFFAASFAVLNKKLSYKEGIYFMSFVGIQLVEYFTWKNLDDASKNRFLSQIALLLIILQPLLLIFSDYNGKNKNVLMGVYLIFALFVLFTQKIDYSMNKASNGHLAWNWLDFSLWITLIWFFFYFFTYVYNKEYFKFILYILVVGSIYYTYYKTKTWGSLWCWIANIISFYLILSIFYKDFCKPI